MKTIIIMLAMLPLAGCASWFRCETPVDKPPVIQYKYIVNQVPEDLLTIPPMVAPIDTTVSSDKDAALWIADRERRTQELEKRLRAVKEFQDNRLKTINIPADIIIK